MNRYIVQRAYAAMRDGVRLGPWISGDSVELSDELASWLLRDSPGIISMPESRAAKPRNRQIKEAKNRSAE